MKKLLVILFSVLFLSACENKALSSTNDEYFITSQPTQDPKPVGNAIFEDKKNFFYSGKLTEKIYIDSTDDITITLENVTASMSESIINIESARSATIILKGDNNLTTTGEEIKTIDSRDDLIIKGDGTLTINSTDTAIKSNDNLTVESGTLVLNATDGDGLRANESLTINGGSIEINSAEGLEATKVIINDGTINIYATVDGINASEKSSKGLTPTIEINGGQVNVNMANGDTAAIDSNGYLYINGGEVNISAQFAFDFDLEAKLNGGNVYVNGQKVDVINNSMFGNFNPQTGFPKPGEGIDGTFKPDYRPQPNDGQDPAHPGGKKNN